MIFKDWNNVIKYTNKLINDLDTKHHITAKYKGYKSSYATSRGIELMIYDIDNNYYKSIYSGTFNTGNEIIASLDTECEKFIKEELS